MKLPGWARRTWHRAHNRLLDAQARLHGACNATTWSHARRMYAPGYSDWRCMKEHEHAGPHRFNSYVWWTGGQPVFSPGDALFQDFSHKRWTAHRHAVWPMGRQRAWNREVAILTQLRRGAAQKILTEIEERDEQRRLR